MIRRRSSLRSWVLLLLLHDHHTRSRTFRRSFASSFARSHRGRPSSHLQKTTTTPGAGKAYLLLGRSFVVSGVEDQGCFGERGDHGGVEDDFEDAVVDVLHGGLVDAVVEGGESDVDVGAVVDVGDDADAARGVGAVVVSEGDLEVHGHGGS